MRVLPAAAVLAAAALTCAAPAAHAQARASAPPSIRLGQRVTARLNASDPQLTERGRFKVYSFRAEAGRRYVATMTAGDFDAVLTLARTVGGITDYMKTDDDGGDDTNARLRFTVPSSGTYLLLAQALDSTGTGQFLLTVDTARHVPLTVRPLRTGTPTRGSLSEDDREYDDAEGYYQLYRLRGTAGRRYRVRMEMPDYVPSLAVGTVDGEEFTAVAGGREAEGGAVIDVTVPGSGEAVVQAGAYGATGPFTLTVTERAAAARPTTQPLRRGQAATGELADGDPEDDDGRFYDLYSYVGRAGERIRIELGSDEFDTMVSLGRMVDGVFEEIESNDDGDEGGETDSVLEVELPEDGRFVVKATSFAAGSEGPYRVRIVGMR